VGFPIDLRGRCPVRDCLLLGYPNGYFDYFPTVLAASRGGHGAGDLDTHVAVGVDERTFFSQRQDEKNDASQNRSRTGNSKELWASNSSQAERRNYIFLWRRTN